MRSPPCLVVISVLGMLSGCQALWGTFGYPNPNNCAPDPSICGAGMECNGLTEVCEPSMPLPSLSQLAWGQQFKLTASDGAALDAMGLSLSLFGDTLLVGAHQADVSGPGNNEGAAYVYVRSPDSRVFTQTAKLVASDSQIGDQGGFSVSMSGDTALVSAHTADPGGLAQAGAAYVFVRSAGQGAFVQQAKLLPFDPEVGALFGRSVSVDGNRALIGANLATEGGMAKAGAAYIFNRNPTNGTWTQQVPRLVAADAASNDNFGFSVSLSGDRALVGSVLANPDGTKPVAGAAYIFARNPTSEIFEQEAKLVASDSVGDEQFGLSVALSGDTAVIGAPNTAVGGKALAGAAYVFVRNASSGVWSQQAKLVAPDGQATDLFGSAVALFGERAVVTARQADINEQVNAGAAYVFRRVPGQQSWVFETKLTATDAAANDTAGFGVSLLGDTLALGAPGKDSSAGSNVGAAYVFQFARPDGNPCTAFSECISLFCVDGVCCDSACGNADPTDCQACSAAAGAVISAAGDGICRPRRPGRLCRASSGDSDLPESCDGQSLVCPPNSGG